jgi:hypothetical protein
MQNAEQFHPLIDIDRGHGIAIHHQGNRLRPRGVMRHGDDPRSENGQYHHA